MNLRARLTGTITATSSPSIPPDLGGTRQPTDRLTRVASACSNPTVWIGIGVITVIGLMMS